MNKIIIGAALLAISTGAAAQQHIEISTMHEVNSDSPRTRINEGGSSYYFEFPDSPRVVQAIPQQPAPVVAAAPAPAPFVEPRREVAPAPVAAAPVPPAPVERARRPDRN